MVRIVISLFAIVAVAVPLLGQRTISLPEVVSATARPMGDIGLQRTSLDSLALKENVALSMADVLAYNSSVFVKNYGRAIFAPSIESLAMI